MANIFYEELKSDVIDRLQYQVDRTITEEDRQLLEAPQRLAKAATEALLRFVLVADAASIPDLVTEFIPTKQRTFRKVNAYKFPEAIFAEREDSGILSVIVNGEELDWAQRTGVESVIYRANSLMYGPKDSVFAFDDLKKRLYAPKDASFSLLIVNHPHGIRPPEQGEFRGASLDVGSPATADGNIEISDGTNTLTIAVENGDTAVEVATAIQDAIVASDTFYYDAYPGDTNTEIKLNIRVGAPLNETLNPTFQDVGTTTVTVTITDIGTYILPISESYHDEIAESFFTQLMDPVRGARKQVGMAQQEDES